jgi:hypothetical protein
MNPRDFKGQGAGKGCRPRNNYSKKFRDNYDAIFKKKATNEPKTQSR